MWVLEDKEGQGDSERLTVISHHRVPLVMFLSRPQMMLYALKLGGEWGQRSKRGHLYSRNHHFLLARHRHFRFRLAGRAHERERQVPPTLPLLSDSKSTTDSQQGQPQCTSLLVVRTQTRLSRFAVVRLVAPALSAGCGWEGKEFSFCFTLSCPSCLFSFSPSLLPSVLPSFFSSSLPSSFPIQNVGRGKQEENNVC